MCFSYFFPPSAGSVWGGALRPRGVAAAAVALHTRGHGRTPALPPLPPHSLASSPHLRRMGNHCPLGRFPVLPVGRGDHPERPATLTRWTPPPPPPSWTLLRAPAQRKSGESPRGAPPDDNAPLLDTAACRTGGRGDGGGQRGLWTPCWHRGRSMQGGAQALGWRHDTRPARGVCCKREGGQRQGGQELFHSRGVTDRRRRRGGHSLPRLRCREGHGGWHPHRPAPTSGGVTRWAANPTRRALRLERPCGRRREGHCVGSRRERDRC